MQEHSMPQTNDKLRDERLRRRWTQQDLADHLETTKLTIGRWERGISTPGPHFRLKLCVLFGKSAEELGLGNVPPSIPSERDVAGEEPRYVSHTDMPALWTVPYRRNLYFTGRDDLLSLLDQHLSRARLGEVTTAALIQPQAIKGLGGIGKTQIAVEYAYRAREQGQYIYTLWIDTASQEALMTSFTQLADLLPEFPAKNETDQQKLVAAIKRWLEQCPERWFLIFDNADDLSLIQEYVPSSGNGSILLTTRASAVGSLAVSIDVEKMGFIEGTHLLLRRAQRFTDASDDDVNEAGNIVVALDHFPLALEQAGAYIEETGCSFRQYLHLYHHHHSVLLARRGTQSTNYPDSVATTWSLSFQKIEQTNPAAAELLRLCAFLAPDHIPEELLIGGAEHWPPVLQQAAVNLLVFDQMIESLLAFSLIKRLAENHLLSIHRLVQVVQMDRMNQEEQRQWAERIVRAVNAVFPRDPKNEIVTWPQCLRDLEQAQACFTLIQQWNLMFTEGADLLERTGRYLYEHASYTIAEPLYQCALYIREQSLGPEHPKVASVLNNLGDLYFQQGQYKEAELLQQRALYIWEQSLGPEYPLVAYPLYGLADLYTTQGKYAQAEPFYQRALYIWEQSLGPEHSSLAYALIGLAELYREQGKYAQAEPFYQRALHIREQSLGPEHLKVAPALNNLAILYRAQGKYDQAEPLYQRALHIWKQNLGPEHPQVAYPFNGLAELYRDQGKYDQAEPLYQRALHIWKQSLGPEHFLVAYPLNNLAILYKVQGKYAQAEPLYQRALHIWEKSLGPEHSQVASALNGLAELYRDQGKYAQAEPLYQRALDIREQSLGSEHPDLTNTLQGFAALRAAQRKSEEAISLYRRALTILEKVYGFHHLKTIETRESLHVVLHAMYTMENEGTRQEK